MRNKRVIDMRGEELDELVFHASRGANDQLYNGIVNRFLAQFEEDLRLIIKEIDYIKAYIQNRDEMKEIKENLNGSEKVENWKPADKSLVEAWKPNPELQKALEKVDKEAFAKSLEEAMKVNTLRTIPVPKVEVPEFKKEADEE